MPNNNYLLETESDLLYDPARYTGIDQVVVDNDNDTIGLSASFISTVNDKLDASTFTAYTASHASDDITPYSAGSNINITNHVISGKDWSNDIASSVSSKLNTSVFDTYSAAHASDDVTPYTNGTGISITNHQISCTGDITPYSAGSNINITNHVISGKDWSSEINSATSGKLDTTATAGWDVTPYSAGIDLKLSNNVVSVDTNSTVTGGEYNFIAGKNNYLNGSYGAMFGNNNSATNVWGDLVVGVRNTVTGSENTVGGNLNEVNGSWNAVFCESHDITGNKNIVGGSNNTISGNSNIVAGEGNNLSGNTNAVFNNSNFVYGDNIFVAGKNNSVTGSSGCFVYGDTCTANIPKGYDNFIFGKNCKFIQNSNASTNCNFLFGNYSEISAGSYANNCVSMGEMNKIYIADMYQWGYIIGATNTISGTPNVSMNGGYIFGANNKINSTRRGFLFGDSLTLNSGTDDYKMKLGYDATNRGYSHRAYIQIDANAGTVSTVIDGTAKEIQNKLTDITDVQVVTALPVSPVANVLYLVKE